MAKGIIVFGAPGAGTSTIGQELARRLGFTHLETDDFSTVKTEIPFTISRPLSERISLLKSAIANICDGFVLSGSMWDWSSPFIPHFKLAVFVTAPTDIRIARLEKREYERYGERIRENGDMYANHCKFIEWAKTYDTNNPDRSLKIHEEWIATLPCPVLRINGADTVEKNVSGIVDYYRQDINLEEVNNETIQNCF